VPRQHTLPMEAIRPGLIGARSPRWVQLVRIGRHPSEPFLLPHAGVMMITGRGPRGGSNGAGKTTLLSGLALASADQDWLRGGIGSSAGNLLFDRVRARTDRQRDAQVGYVIVVYCDERDPDGSAISVWMRLQRQDPYVRVKAVPGVRFARGTSEEQRVAHAEQTWSTLNTETYGASEFAPALFGSAPRCLAYLRNRGGKDTDHGLLAAGGKPLRPELLAELVIGLSGKQELIATERELRGQLAEEQRKLERQRVANARQFDDEEIELNDIRLRARAHELLEKADEHWRLHLALGVERHLRERDAQERRLTNAQAEVDRLETEIEQDKEQLRAARDTGELEQRHLRTSGKLKRIEQDQRELYGKAMVSRAEAQRCETALTAVRTQALGGDAECVDEAGQRLTEAQQKVDGLTVDAKLLEAKADEARKNLAEIEAGRGGDAGPALAALHAANLQALSLVDVIQLGTMDSRGRSRWEARLAPYRAAIVVAQADASDVHKCLTAAGALAGVQVLAVPELPDEHRPISPETDSDSMIGALLATLAERMSPASTSADAVTDPGLGLTLYGGYAVPLTDRLARAAAAKGDLDRLESLLHAKQGDIGAAKLTAGSAKTYLDACQAKARMMELEALIEQHRLDDGAHTEAAQQLEPDIEVARRVADAARRAYTDAEQNAIVLADAIKEKKAKRDAHAKEAGDARTQRARASGQLTTWLEAFGTDTTSARALIDALSEQPSQDAEGLSARHCVTQALSVTGYDTESAEPTGDRRIDSVLATLGAENLADLRRGILALAGWSTQTRPAAGEAPRPFREIVYSLATWLELVGSEDERRGADIDVGRHEREGLFKAAEIAAGETGAWLESEREEVITQLKAMFTDTETRLNVLLAAAGRDKVRLRPSSIPPANPAEPLRWRLSPQWEPRNSMPIDYQQPPNTAEVLILHSLLAASTLVTTGDAKGRLLIIDESGNNLDAVSVSELASALAKIAEQHGITVILACQDVYSEQVAAHCTSSLSLLRADDSSPLNSVPLQVHGPDNPRALALLENPSA
jgi:hypothetical protein